jgi:hypothetical protein
MPPKVRNFDLNLPSKPTSQEKTAPSRNVVPDLPKEAVERISASAPLQSQRPLENSKRGNQRPRRYCTKTYSLVQEDIDRIEGLLLKVRQAGLYDRSRSDLVRAGIALLSSLPIEEQIKAVDGVENLHS